MALYLLHKYYVTLRKTLIQFYIYFSYNTGVHIYYIKRCVQYWEQMRSCGVPTTMMTVFTAESHWDMNNRRQKSLSPKVLSYCSTFTLCPLKTNTFWRRCFWFLNILVYPCVQKWGKKKRWNPTMAFEDSQLACVAKAAQICTMGWIGRTGQQAISKGLCRILIFLLSPLLDTWVDQNIQKSETSSSKGIRYKGAHCAMNS